jgi:hypothetical protein
MKRIGLWLSLLLASLWPVGAQVNVEVSQEQDQFLPGESLRTTVRITNRSGQTLSLGAEDNWLTFSVESANAGMVSKVGEVPVTGAFLLESSKTAIKRVDLAPYFSFGQPGRYSIVATMRVRNWDHEIASSPKFFDIVEGAKLWEQDFGVPKSAGASNAVPEVRRYILQQANYIKSQLRLYLRVMDASGKVLRVAAIGPIFAISRPEPHVDEASNLHVLYQNGARSYSYTMFSPDGTLLKRETYDYVSARPRIGVDEDGKSCVVGGVRRVTATDYPPPPPPAVLPAEALQPGSSSDQSATSPDEAKTAKP